MKVNKFYDYGNVCFCVCANYSLKHSALCVHIKRVS